MGLAHTHFSNFDGLPWPTETSTYSTPADLVALGRAAMRYPVFRAIVDQQTDRLAASPRHHAYVWRTTNLLLRDYPGAIGIKTGKTAAAGYCLLFEARETATLIGVVLHSSRPTTWPRSAMPPGSSTGASGTFSLQGGVPPARFDKLAAAEALLRHLTPMGGHNTWGS